MTDSSVVTTNFCEFFKKLFFASEKKRKNLANSQFSDAHDLLHESEKIGQILTLV